MCGEFVKEINELLDLNKSTLANATRYSYLISQQVDLQAQLVETYGGCFEAEAKAKPKDYCVKIMTKPIFDMYAPKDKASNCQIAL